jgi:hypothetical protein
MKKTLLITGLFAAATLVSQSALAEVKIRAGTGSSTYSLGGDYTHAKSTYHPTSFGLTFSSESGLYLDIAASSGSGKHDGWATANVHSVVCSSSLPCNAAASPNEDFKRSDWALIFGESHVNQSSGIATTFYVGFKGGSTTLGALHAQTLTHWTEEKFDSYGVVFGGGASFPIAQGKAGSVGVNLGLGIMGATWKDNGVPNYNVSATSAIGGSFGVNYTYPITQNFGVVAEYKGNSYSYSFGSDTSTTKFTISESINYFGASIYAKF